MAGRDNTDKREFTHFSRQFRVTVERSIIFQIQQMETYVRKHWGFRILEIRLHRESCIGLKSVHAKRAQFLCRNVTRGSLSQNETS